MTRVRWALLTAMATLAGGGGCVSCAAHSARANWEAGPACPVPACERQHVYAVLVNGACPAGGCSLEGLRDGLTERGFVKTYYGQVVHVLWLASEMRTVARCDPAARFVVVGADIGAPVAARLARQAAADGLAVDALVLLDPVLMSSSAGCSVRTVLVTSGGDCSAAHTERATVEGANRLTLPGHSGTIDFVCGLLTESAGRVELPAVVTEVIADPDTRQPRDLSPPPGLPGEWLFLHEQPGYVPPPLPAPYPNLGPIAPSLVPRGGYIFPERLPRPQFMPWLVPAPGQPLPTPRPVQPGS
ncbi:MAG TPA: hypothetical protein VD866_31900 [Urbifossiella sp.]|nr:hypothetical protein [Urbifossiella sp.]